MPTNQPSTSRRLIIVVASLAVIILAAGIIKDRGHVETPDQTEPVYRKLSDTTIVATSRNPSPIIVDESQVYFSHILNGDFAISQLAQKGGVPIPIELPFTSVESISVLNGITPDKQALLIRDAPMAKRGNLSTDMWTVPLNKDDPTYLGRGGGGVYSPSGDQLLFSKFRNDLTIANPDMTGAREVLSASSRVSWPRFSPDGTTIRFTQFTELASNRFFLWEVGLDGGQASRLFPDSNMEASCCGSWSPDGKYYVFQASTDDGMHLWALESSESGGAEPFQVTSGETNFGSPAFSADGKAIFAFGSKRRGELVEFDSSTNSFNEATGLESLAGDQLSFSLDKQSAVYVSYPDSSLWRKNLSDGSEQQLTFPPMQVRDPRWSPDGETIAFDGLVPGERTRIYTVAADGGPLVLASDPNCSSSSASWSDVGRYIVFDDWCSDTIRTFHPTTGELSHLPGSEDLQWPSWSPDGKQLVALTKNTVVLFDPLDGTVEQIVGSGQVPNFFHYSWSADSDSLYFIEAQYRNPERFVHRLDVNEKTITKVAQIGQERSAAGSRGHWVGISLAGNPLMLRDTSENNIYALEWDRD